MRIAYLNCFSGISGDMIIGALIDAGLKKERLEQELNKLNLSGYRLEVKKVVKKGISATNVKVIIEEEGIARKLKDIVNIIDKSTLNASDKKQIKKIFYKIGKSEAQIHQKDIESVHFHEVGGMDSIIDIASAVVGLRLLGIKEVYASALPLGHGFVKCAHGSIPVPAPATLELLKGVPVYDGGVNSEMVTPTGAGIVTSYVKKFEKRPLMEVKKVGYGAGEKDFAIPNLLRITIGEIAVKNESILGDYIRDEAILVETNIDDMNPEIYDFIIEKLLSQGALDVYLTPIQMKKNRPAHILSLIAYENDLKKLLVTLFDESTTMGVRIREVKRLKLMHKSIIADTEYGKVRTKVAIYKGEVKNIAPEYEDCRKIAGKHKVPLKSIYDEAKEVAREKLK
ncbi:MAG: nickel pincer cofactor biosynthesis protein LarC [Candidatus Atribacteria bacterium]|nr:nickel pincer cofactor biosynthesis protein LarC [Candidatus Atribacteria bacterium]